jgi:DNA-binding IclR family transcriptional regulator
MLSLSQISPLNGVPKSTTHRVLAMLVELGAVERSGIQYRMGDVMFSYGARSPEAALRGAALPHLASAETINRYLDRRLPARTDASITSPDSLRHELACIQIQKLGIAFDNAEAARGLHCVAAPVRIGGRAVAAVSVAYPSSAGSGLP